MIFIADKKLGEDAKEDLLELTEDFEEEIKIKNKDEIVDTNIVKVHVDGDLKNDNFLDAKDFFRTKTNLKNEKIYHHIGIYCYKVSVLEKFVNLDQTKNEIKNRLEQLRALENNIKINVAFAESSPIGVDTKEDYLALKKIMEYKS